MNSQPRFSPPSRYELPALIAVYIGIVIAIFQLFSEPLGKGILLRSFLLVIGLPMLVLGVIGISLTRIRTIRVIYKQVFRIIGIILLSFGGVFITLSLFLIGMKDNTPLMPTPIATPSVTASHTPMPTPEPTNTPTQTSSVTPTPPWSAIFQDDFENDLSKWKVDAGWELQQDDAGNQFVCISTGEGEYKFLTPRVSDLWTVYRLELKVLTAAPFTDSSGAFSIDVHRDTSGPVLTYQFQVSYKHVNLSRYNPETRYVPITFSEDQPELVQGIWYPLQFEIAENSILSYSFDNLNLITFDDGENFIPRGIIRIGVTPLSDVCFDDVIVSAP